MTATLSYFGNFLAREITDNGTIITSRSPFRSWTGHPPSFLPHFLPLHTARIAGHSIYISVLLPLWQESFHDYDILREENQSGSACSTYLSFHLTLLSSPPSISLSLSFSLSLLAAHRRFCSRSLSSIRSPRLVRQSDAIMTSEEDEKRTRRCKPIALMVAFCTHRSIFAVIGYLR